MASQPSHTASLGYAGDIDAASVWDRMAADPASQLIDVRTEAEWSFVGVPDLSSLGRQTLFCQWVDFPNSARNPRFTSEVAAALAEIGYAAGGAIFLLCRSGGRSRAAAIALTADGYGKCFNVSDGFEGALDAERHRGRSAGWKARGLPWVQS